MLNSFRRTSAFTLIELLVVVAIIGILAAILFPVFARVRENARRANCQSNLKQIGLGVAQYTQDYDEKFPIFENVNGATGFFILVQPYMKSDQVFQCPSELHLPPPDASNGNDGNYSDYAHNLVLSWDGTARSYSIANLTKPTLTVLAIDDAESYGNNFSCGCGGQATPSCTTPGLAYLEGSAAQRHLETHNVLFCDGHVKAYKGQTSTVSSAIYNWATPGTTSGNNPTFNPAP